MNRLLFLFFFPRGHVPRRLTPVWDNLPARVRGYILKAR